MQLAEVAVALWKMIKCEGFGIRHLVCHQEFQSLVSPLLESEEDYNTYFIGL